MRKYIALYDVWRQPLIQRVQHYPVLSESLKQCFNGYDLLPETAFEMLCVISRLRRNKIIAYPGTAPLFALFAIFRAEKNLISRRVALNNGLRNLFTNHRSTAQSYRF